jgi:nicotinamide riboside kinase
MERNSDVLDPILPNPADKTAPSPFEILPGSRTTPDHALVVNIFGGPGTGKSTLAAAIFCALKQRHIETACPEECAKLAIWSNQSWILDHQPIILGRTWETIYTLLDKVDVIIVDSPILLCSVYARDREPMCFHQMVGDIHKRTHRINLLIKRDTQIGYSTNGRRETEREARLVDERIIGTLDAFNEPFVTCSSDQSLVERLAETVVGAKTPQ